MDTARELLSLLPQPPGAVRWGGTAKLVMEFRAGEVTALRVEADVAEDPLLPHGNSSEARSQGGAGTGSLQAVENGVPRIAVVTPVGGSHIERSREAARSAIRAGADLVVLVGDGVEPPSFEEPRVVVTRLPEWRGRSAARNRGAEIARELGIEWLYFLDADDLLCPWGLEELRRVMHEEPEAGIIEGRLLAMVPDDLAESLRQIAAENGSPPPPDVVAEMEPGNGICMCLRTERFFRLGGFDEAIDLGEDADGSFPHPLDSFSPFLRC